MTVKKASGHPPLPKEKTARNPLTFSLCFFGATWFSWLFLQFKGFIDVFRCFAGWIRPYFWLVQLLQHCLCYWDHHGSGGSIADPHGQEGSHTHEAHEKSDTKRFGKVSSELSSVMPFFHCKALLTKLLFWKLLSNSHPVVPPTLVCSGNDTGRFNSFSQLCFYILSTRKGEAGSLKQFIPSVSCLFYMLLRKTFHLNNTC